MQGPRKPLAELMSRMQTWIDAWDVAHQDLVEEDEPFDVTSYHLYLQWYMPRTRTRLVCMKHRQDEGMVPQALLYPGHAGRSLHEAVCVHNFLQIRLLLLHYMTIVHDLTYTSYDVHRLT